MHGDQRLEELFRSLANYERTRTLASAWSLDNMHRLLAASPPAATGGTWVQVGGSKGKGSTVGYLEALGRAGGLRTGAFVSPHLERVTERVRLDGSPVPAPLLVEALEAVLDRARDLGLELSFFEAITAAAVRIFRAARLDLVALEVGLGGRLDATTAVPVDAVILTRIELEHTDLLGATLEEIATEKAHIMRPDRPVFVEADAAVFDLFRIHQEGVRAGPLHPVAVVDAEDTAHGWTGRLVDRSLPEEAAGLRFRLPGASRFELPALALAHACLRSLRPEWKCDLDPAPRPVLAGRFEVIPGSADGTGPWPTVLDGAHTPASSAQVAAELRRRFPGQPVVALFASAEGKRWQEGLRELLPVVDRFLVTSVVGTPSVPAAQVATWLQQQGWSAMVIADPAMGWAELSRCEAVRLVVGSFYLVGAVRSSLSKQHE